jgi:mannose-6-phosphate isomerase
MVIPERVTPSGVVLPDIKLHGGLGFDKMMDCFVYKGMDEVSTRRSYFKTPQRKTSVHTVLADASVTDKFRFDRLDVAGEYRFMCDSYGIILATEGQGTMNGIHLEAGDRFFISENESVLDLRGNFTLLLCRP